MVIVLFVGCKDTHSAEPGDSAAVPGPYSLQLVLKSMLPGSTNAGATPSVTIETSDYLARALAPTLATDLETRCRFVSAEGNAVAVAPVTPQQDGTEYVFVLQPAVPLLSETWYDVTYPSSPLKVPDGSAFEPVFDVSSKYYLGESILTRFFTSSAPQLREVDVLEMMDGGAGTSHVLYVYMSEEVSLEDLLSGGFVVSSGSAPLVGTCLMGTRPCGDSSAIPSVPNSEVTSGVQYQLADQVPVQFELALALALRGSPRTVQEAFDAGDVRGTTVVSDGLLRYPMDISSWRLRSAPRLMGWLNVEN
jgi:hypothetical protein